MKISRFTWIVYTLIAVISFSLWFKFSYPELSFVQLNVSRDKALDIGKKYLAATGANPDSFYSTIVFSFDNQTNRYLQKTIGFDKELKFLKKNDFDLFFWLIRFFKETDKEEYRVTVSSSTGEITALKHIIDDNDPRPSMEKEDAQQKAIEFLKNNFSFNPDLYSVQGDFKITLDHRVEYSFSWQKKDVNIPWNDDPNSGIGKLIIGATVSGGEILSFSKNSFSVPDQFNRFIEKQREVSYNLAPILRILYFVLFIAAIFFVVVRRNHLAMHTTKKFYIGITIFSFVLSILYTVNNLQYILFDYPSTSTFRAFFWRLSIDAVLNAIMINVGLLIPSLSGELLHYEMFPKKKEGSFLYYIHSTFLSRGVSERIMLGYLVCIIMLGIQSVLISLGKSYLGVWTEHSWMIHMSSAYLPFLIAFTIGYKASFTEEILYRLFANSWGKKIFKSTLLAVLFSSLVWGFSHSSYPVYPMWFRGVEVTILGFFLSTIYFKFGIIPVIIAHYLFDVFWSSAEHLLGHSQPGYFYSSLIILILPALWAFASYLLNKKEEEMAMAWRLNKHQQFNLEVLKNYLKTNGSRYSAMPDEELKKEIFSHGWDLAVVEIAINEWRK